VITVSVPGIRAVAAEDLEGHARACDMAMPGLAMPDLMQIGGITGWPRAMALAEATRPGPGMAWDEDAMARFRLLGGVSG